MTDWAPGPALAAYHSGVTVICELAAQFTDEAWAAPTTCPEWRAADLAGHLRCVADDYHEYLDDAPVSRMARLMARGPSPESLARKLARQNAAELAALPDATGPEHIAAFAAAARGLRRPCPGRLGSAAPPVRRHRGDRWRHGGRRLCRVAPARLGPGRLAGQGLPAGQPGTAGCRLAGGHAAPAAGYRRGYGAVRRGGGARAVAVAGAAGPGRGHSGPVAAAHEGAWQALLRASGRLPR